MPNIESSIVEVCVFKLVERKPMYLVLRRSPQVSLFPGIWQIITGRIEAGEHAVHAAEREVREETGLAAERFWSLPFINSFYEPVHDIVHLCPHFAVQVVGDAEVRLSEEHEEFEWCQFERAQTLLLWTGQRTGVRIVETQIVQGTEESRLLEIPPDHPERKQ